MIEVFGCIVLTAFFVNGLVIASNPEMLLEPLKLWLKEKLTKLVMPKQYAPTFYEGVESYYDKSCKGTFVTHKIYKPLIGCVRCMPSIYGTIICLCFLPFTIHLLYIIPVVIACSSTLAAIIHTQYI